MSPNVFRFAPSPNGRLHLGHAYSALCNARAAERHSGQLLLRIEDTDLSRSRRDYEAGIQEDLARLGVAFDGPVRRQSDHLDDYARAFACLDEAGLVYPCFCTRSQIAAASGGARDPDGAPVHAGPCRAISAEETRARLAAGESAAWRLNLERALAQIPGPLSWSEFGEGETAQCVRATPLAWGDIPLRGRERPAAYHLAVVVDDALQGVSDVVRGRDLQASTSLHRLLQALLGLPAPRYRHHRLVLDEQGRKLSKSAGSRSLASLREAGVTALDIRTAFGFDTGGGGLVARFS